MRPQSQSSPGLEIPSPGDSGRLSFTPDRKKSSLGHSVSLWVFGLRGLSKVLFSDCFHSPVAESQEVVAGALQGPLLEAQNREAQTQVEAQPAAHKVAAGQLH